MQFKEWLKLQEVGTGTNAIAIFAQPVMGMVRRATADDLELGGKKKKKKKHHDDDDDLPGLAD
jgi:hypothetical protein